MTSAMMVSTPTRASRVATRDRGARRGNNASTTSSRLNASSSTFATPPTRARHRCRRAVTIRSHASPSPLTDEFDDDDVAEDEEDAAAARACGWLAAVERATTLGAASSGVASVVLQEVTLGAVAGALPLVGALARRARERRVRAGGGARERARREELDALRAKASRGVTMREAAKTAAPAAVEAVRKDVTPVLEELASRLSSVERAQIEAAKTAAKTARDSGAVAGMLARDLAAARVDAREGIASVRNEFRTTADEAKGELRKEMTMLWELVESVEKDTAGLRRPMEALAEEIRDVVEGVARDRDVDEMPSSSSSSSTVMTLSSEQLAELRAAVADTTSARVREAVEQLLGSINAVTSEETIVQSLATKLDDAQWEAMVKRLDSIDEGVRTSSERVVEDDLEDLRLEIRREISRDMRRVVESVDALKLALEEAQATSSETNARGEGSTEAAAAVKQWAEEKLKAAETPRELEEQIQWHAAVVDAEEEEETEKELVWVGETTAADAPKKKAMNEGVSREEAFANMQRLLNSKPSTETPSKSPVVAESGSEPESDAASAKAVVEDTGDADGDDVWDPFIGAADAENVAKYEAELASASETSADAVEANESRETTTDAASRAEAGLEALRAGRDLARRGGEKVDTLEDADEMFADAIAHFERALEMEPTPRAQGNLGNAHLARGRVQATLAAMAFREAANARNARVNAGLEGTAEMYAELAEENLIEAGRKFRAVVSSMRDDESATSGVKAEAKALAGWGSALALRSELVLDSRGATEDAESLALAAAEKYKAAAAIEPTSPSIYVAWGDALRMTASLGPAEDEDELLRQASGCYSEALRLDPDNDGAREGLDALAM